VAPLLPANGLVRALALLTAWASRAHEVGAEPFLRQSTLRWRADGMVMVREKQMPAGELNRSRARWCTAVMPRAHRRCCMAMPALPRRAAPTEAPACCGLLQTRARPPAGLGGASCHDADELEHAQLDLDQLGAVADREPSRQLRWDALRELMANCTLPVYALKHAAAASERAWQAARTARHDARGVADQLPVSSLPRPSLHRRLRGPLAQVDQLAAPEQNGRWGFNSLQRVGAPPGTAYHRCVPGIRDCRSSARTGCRWG
jgi:hypothetical protein